MKFDQITLNDVPENFAQKFNCAQMVFGHAARYLDIDEDSAVRTAAFFGTGLRRGLTCGAVTGALMALGYKFGHDQPGDETMRMQVLAKAREFEDRFTAQAGALECRDILGHDVSTPEGRIAALAADLFNTKCPEVIMTACGILDEMLAQA